MCELILSDGSKFIFNIDIQVVVIYIDCQCLIEFKCGEFYIEVVKDISCLFSVFVDGQMIQVVGMVFNVEWVNDILDLLVIEGWVWVVL